LDVTSAELREKKCRLFKKSLRTNSRGTPPDRYDRFRSDCRNLRWVGCPTSLIVAGSDELMSSTSRRAEANPQPEGKCLNN